MSELRYKMRRAEKLRSREVALKLMAEAEYATIGAVLPDGQPYNFVISHAIVGDRLYFHSALEGLKCTAIEQNPKVCVSCVGKTNVIAEKFSTEFESAVAFGVARLVTEEAELRQGFDAICGKFSPGHDWMAKYGGMYKTGVKLYAVELEEVTGKGNVE